MTLFRQNSDGTIRVALQQSSNDTFSAKPRRDYQSGTSKLQQKFNNRQNIKEKNEIDHNFNIELSILNIKNSFNISFF